MLLGPDRYDMDIYLSFGLTEPDLVASTFVNTIHVYAKKGEMVPDKNGRKEWEEFVGIQLLFFWCILKFHPEYQGGLGKLEVPMEIEKAMDLFLLDSLDNKTEAVLKARRNALMKIFHPDEGGGQMEDYAKKSTMPMIPSARRWSGWGNKGGQENGIISRRNLRFMRE